MSIYRSGYQPAATGSGGGGGFPWGAALTMGGGLLSGLLAPQQHDPMPTITRPGMGAQVDFLRELIRRQQAPGQGEFGFGQVAKQVNATLQAMMGQRNISPQSGVAGSLYANLLSQAMGRYVQNRRLYGLQLAQARPWTMAGQEFRGSMY